MKWSELQWTENKVEERRALWMSKIYDVISDELDRLGIESLDIHTPVESLYGNGPYPITVRHTGDVYVSLTINLKKSNNKQLVHMIYADLHLKHKQNDKRIDGVHGYLRRLRS